MRPSSASIVSPGPGSAGSEGPPIPGRRPAGGARIARRGRLGGPSAGPRARLAALFVGLVAAAAGPEIAAAAPPPTFAEDERPEPRRGFGGEVRAAGSVHRPGFAVTLVGDYAWRRAAVGVGVEVNPYVGVVPGEVTPGALHVFAAAEHRVPLGRVTLRQRIGVGPAILLATQGDHRRGSVGVFLEGAPLGLEIQTRVKRIAVVLDAFSFALSAPSLAPAGGGDPLARVQYRAAVGFRF